MKKYNWIRKEALRLPITREDSENLWGKSDVFAHSQQTLLYSVMWKVIVYDDHISLRGFLNDWFCPNDSLLETYTPALVFTKHQRAFKCERELIDAGALGELTKNGYLFTHSRNLARTSAILIMYAMQEMDKKYKIVSIIIGRAIWASRAEGGFAGHCENWLNCERPLKK